LPLELDEERYPVEVYPFAVQWHDATLLRGLDGVERAAEGITYSRTRPEYFGREDRIVRWPEGVPREPLKRWFGE
jgi:hypothetical protein